MPIVPRARRFSIVPLTETALTLTDPDPDVRLLALSLPRTTEALVRGCVKFRVGRIVYLAVSRDETELGFAFPKEEREWLVGTEPETGEAERGFGWSNMFDVFWNASRTLMLRVSLNRYCKLAVRSWLAWL